MPAIHAINLSQASVTYNGVLIGGGTATYKSLPPRFRLGYRVLMDDTRRVFKGLQYTLSVQAIFSEADQATMGVNMQALATALSAQGKKLQLIGLGLGFADPIVDVAGGPHPLGKPEMRMLGENAWELLWSIEFTVNPCLSNEATPKTLVAFNYTTNWSNDFEGNCTRGISGYYELINIRNPNAPKVAVSRAEHNRPLVTVAVPNGFRRMQNDWLESADKKRVDFSVTDQQMPGDPYPPGIIEIDASETFATNPMDWSKANVSLSATIRIAPGSPRTLGGLWFLAAAMTKQANIAANLPATSQVLPAGLTITAGKFGSSRVMSASFSWTIAGCAYQYLTSGAIWSPVSNTNYQQWRTSIESLWANRGNAQVVASVDDDVIIDLCDNVTGATIGRDSVTLPSVNPASSLSLACPDVPEDGGWLEYDLQVRAQRSDHQTLHRKATAYDPYDSIDTASEGYVPTGGPSYTTTPTTDHVVEYNGLPSTLVVLRFKARRYRRLPVMPQITTVGGKPVTLIEQVQEGPKREADLLGCPLYSIVGYRIYRVSGYVATIRSTGSKVSCADPTTPSSV